MRTFKNQNWSYVYKLNFIATMLKFLQLSTVFLSHVKGNTWSPSTYSFKRFFLSSNGTMLRNLSSGSLHEVLPNFDAVTPSYVKNEIPKKVDKLEEQFKKFENSVNDSLVESVDPTWVGLIDPMETMFDDLKNSWKTVSHLNNVKNTDQFRKAYEKTLPYVVKVMTKMSQSKPIFESMTVLKEKTHGLDNAQSRILASSIRSAYLSGVSLEGDSKKEFGKLIGSLANLTTQFSNNVLDSTKEFSITITDPLHTNGIPVPFLKLFAAAANNQSKDPDFENGPWKITLDQPSYETIMKHSRNATLRQTVYQAHIARASSGSTDNGPVLESIRDHRRQMAKLLGFKDFATMSLHSKMAQNVDAVMEMIESLKEKCKSVAQKELKDLQEFASKHGHIGKLKNWDVGFWSERQREDLFNLKEEELRPYFPLPRVLEGLFKLSKDLFEIDIQRVDDGINTWHKDVSFYRIFNSSGHHIASFYLDPFSRPAEKRGGAWMDGAVDRSEVMHRIPIAYLNCNQMPAANDTPSLMTFRDVETLFHEYGHGLQHMLTTVKYSDAAGINNIEWDAVEIPSQFMENWLYDWSTMQLVSSHYETGAILPKEYFDSVVLGRKFMAGSQMLRQLYLSALDMDMYISNEPWQDIMKRVSDEFTIMKPLPEDSFPCSFTHIFSSGYAAGYYSYKWAEVMAADAFSAFTDVGLSDKDAVSEMGRRFRDSFLSLGGGMSPHDVFRQFRGRKPRTDALLAMYGLSEK